MQKLIYGAGIMMLVAGALHFLAAQVMIEVPDINLTSANHFHIIRATCAGAGLGIVTLFLPGALRPTLYAARCWRLLSLPHGSHLAVSPAFSSMEHLSAPLQTTTCCTHGGAVKLQHPSSLPAKKKETFVIKQVFINLPVANLQKSMAFFKALGFLHDPKFSGDPAAACIIVNDTISVMLCSHDKFRDFTPKAICDTSKAVEVLLNLRCDSRDEVDSLVAKAIAAGGSTYDEPEDFGFMYTHSFVDPDGHGWGLFHMSAPSE